MPAMTLPHSQEPVDATLLPQLLELYLDECVNVKRLAPHTIDNYRHYISPLITWLEQQTSPFINAALWDDTKRMGEKRPPGRSSPMHSQT